MGAISSVTAFLVKAKMVRPFRIAYDYIEEVETVFVRVETRDGLVGWGEAPPAPKITGDTVESIGGAVKAASKALKGLDPLEYVRVWRELGRVIKGNPAAKDGITSAVLDLAGKAAGLPTYRLLGGWVREFETDYTLSLDEPEAMAEEAREWVSKGFRVLKVKLGGPPERDVERVRAVREAVGESVALRVDANQAWSLKEALLTIKSLEALGVELVEQPLPAGALDDLRVLRERTLIPIVLDESVHTLTDAVKAVTAGACDGVNVKLAKAGGILGGLEIANTVSALGKSLMIGCMSETRLGIAAAAHLVAAHGGFRYVDLDADLFLQEDPASGGFVRDGGIVRLADRPGLGVDVREDVLKPLKPGTNT